MNRDKVYSFLSLTEEKIARFLSGKDINNTIRWLSLRASLLYELGDVYSDTIIERNIQKVATIIDYNADNSDSLNNSNRIVFYDAFSRDRRGLSNQYLSALIASGFDFLYITENKNFEKTELYFQIEKYHKGSYIILPLQYGDSQNRIIQLISAITCYQPKTLLLHLAPWSIDCLVAVSALPYVVNKVNINITDHAFWAGASLMDYNIEFREYGKNISLKYRGLLETQEVLQPYYPYIDIRPFKGFGNIDTNKKTVLFFGGSLYKIYDDSLVFLDLVAQALNENPNCICICAGSGDANIMLQYIKEHRLENKWYYLGFRDDIFQVVQHVDIVINTYPIGGGLMCQYAAICSKPVISYGDIKNESKFIEGILRTKEKITHITKHDFQNNLTRLINDFDYRRQLGLLLNRCVVTPEVFNKGIKDLFLRLDNTIKGGKNIVDLSSSVSVPNGGRNNYEIEPMLVKYLGLKSLLYYPKTVLWLAKYFHQYMIRKFKI